MNTRLAIVLLLFIATIHADSQVTFSKGNDRYRADVNHNSGMAGGCVDLNGDYYDDILALNRSRVLEVGYNNGANQKMNWQQRVNVSSNEEYSIIAGDLNNDGQSEIISSGVYNGGKVYRLAPTGTYQLQNRLQPSVYGQAANFADVNNDGFLDFFLCHDEGDNLLFLNDKKGNLIYDRTMLNFNTVPPSDNSGNYGSEWCDVDNDGDLDLYIAKCKAGVQEVEDPRRHNMLFINNNGKFTNEAEVRGLKDKGQSWTGSFADYDNDGDLDCIVTNHDMDHRLYENNGKGYFTISKADISLGTSFAFQSLWADFDNNGWQDLLLVGDNVTELHLNTNGKKFNRVNKPFNNFLVNSASIGDLNDDGFIDVAAIYGKEINLPSNVRDELWLNDGNKNNFIKILLKGLKSNAVGIGTKLTLFTSTGIQYRELQSGVSYGVSNSNNILFGLGSQVVVDSIIVKWPSGVIDKMINPKINSSHLVTEGICYTQRLTINAEKSILCPNESVNLSLSGLPSIGKKITWNNNDTSEVLSVNKPGHYIAKIQLANGCNYITDIKSISNPNTNKLLQNAQSDTLFFCDQQRLSVFPYYRTVTWSNGQVGNSITLQQSANLSVQALNVCNEIVSENIIAVKLPNVSNITNVKNDTVKVGENAILKAMGEQITWYNSQDQIVAIGDSLLIPSVQVADTYYAAASIRKGVQSYKIGEPTPPTSSNVYSANSLDFGLIFQAYDNLVIKSLDVASDKEGIRRIIILNNQGIRIYQKDFFIKSSAVQTCELNAFIPQGSNYIIKTDTTVNVQNLGYRSPRLVRVQESAGYPFEINSLMEISSSSSNTVDYYYFFNINIENLGTLCTSEKVKASIVIEVNSAVDNDIDPIVTFYPNPTSNSINIQSIQSFNLSITDVNGSIYRTEKILSGENILTVNNIPNGLYFLNFVNEKQQIQKKIIITH